MLLAFGAFGVIACNAILGIEEARLGDASVGMAGVAVSVGMGGTGGTAGTGGAAGAGGEGGGACSLMAPDPCNQCVAQRCCDKYDACIADNDCKDALKAYNVCVGIDFTNDAGGTCDETLGASANPLRSDLATCAFQNGPTTGCADVCTGKPVGGDICSGYCACVVEACPDKSFDGADCLAVCGAFTEPQLTCRPYHCGLAKSAKMNNNEASRLTHCGHTFGEALCP
jgi:hypothetical protein